MKKFWMLWAEGTNFLCKQYAAPEEASKEAERLAREMGKKMFLMEMIACCESEERPIHWISIT